MARLFRTGEAELGSERMVQEENQAMEEDSVILGSLPDQKAQHGPPQFCACSTADEDSRRSISASYILFEVRKRMLPYPSKGCISAHRILWGPFQATISLGAGTGLLYNYA